MRQHQAGTEDTPVDLASGLPWFAAKYEAAVAFVRLSFVVPGSVPEDASANSPGYRSCRPKQRHWASHAAYSVKVWPLGEARSSYLVPAESAHPELAHHSR